VPISVSIFLKHLSFIGFLLLLYDARSAKWGLFFAKWLVQDHRCGELPCLTRSLQTHNCTTFHTTRLDPLPYLSEGDVNSSETAEPSSLDALFPPELSSTLSTIKTHLHILIKCGTS
jgi:hypothetical protein